MSARNMKVTITMDVDPRHQVEMEKKLLDWIVKSDEEQGVTTFMGLPVIVRDIDMRPE